MEDTLDVISYLYIYSLLGYIIQKHKGLSIYLWDTYALSQMKSENSIEIKELEFWFYINKMNVNTFMYSILKLF